MEIKDKIIAVGLELNLTLSEVFEVKHSHHLMYKYKDEICQVFNITERLDYINVEKQGALEVIYEDYPELKGCINEKEFLHTSNDELSKNCSMWNIDNMIYYVKRW